MEAHLLLSQLESEGIQCWLKDENTVTTIPVWTIAVGGIKLMVSKKDLERAKEILIVSEIVKRQSLVCPKCNSHNVELVSTPRKIANWFSALLTFFFGNYALAVDNVMHCFDCGHEFNPPVDQELPSCFF